MTSLSKSSARALGCPSYYAAYYLSDVEQIRHSFTRVGSEFHDFHAKYVEHLVDEDRPQDIEWARDWMSRNPLLPESRELINQSAPLVRIDPQRVLGTEVFCACDADFKALNLPFPGVGKSPRDPRAIAHGTMDLVTSPSPEYLVIDDYKTGWVSKADNYEAIHYAVLAFAQWPAAKEILFVWRFVRCGAPVEAKFMRSDLPEMQSTVRSKIAERDAIVAAAVDKHWSQMDVNPFAGLCSYCGLSCRLRQAALDKEFHTKPAQTEDDAAGAMAELVSIRARESALESAVRDYVEHQGPLSKGQFEAVSEMAATRKIPLRPFLAALGVDVPETSPNFDVPLDNLYLISSSVDSYARAKKRRGMYDLVDSISVKTPRATLRVRMVEEES